MSSHLSQQLMVPCLEYTATENQKASCIIYDITVLAGLIWLNLYLLNSIIGFYFYSVYEITIIILHRLWPTLWIYTRIRNEWFCFVFLLPKIIYNFETTRGSSENWTYIIILNLEFKLYYFWGSTGNVLIGSSILVYLYKNICWVLTI